MLTSLAIAGYRSLRDLVLPLSPLTLVVGANGSGKSNLYRALRLLAAAAQGGMVAAIAREGGLASVLWAGPERFGAAVRRGDYPVQGTQRQERQRLLLGFASDDLSYCVDLGLPARSAQAQSAFLMDPEIKLECLWTGPVYRPAASLLERKGPVLRTRAGRSWEVIDSGVAVEDSMLARGADPTRAPELLVLRDRVRAWRFYDHFRSDADAPARQRQIGTRTPALAHDGRDLCAALATILEIGDADALVAAVDDAFPGAELSIENMDGRFGLAFHQPGLLRPLDAAELSDGTLRFLLWAAALLTPRPPPLLVLNEPETSLHPELLPALARLIAATAERTQVWVVSHSPILIDALAHTRQCAVLRLEKRLSETQLSGQDLLDAPPWRWPER